MPRIAGICVALGLLLALPADADDVSGGLLQPAFKSGVPVELEADSLEYESGRDLYVARGNVRIQQGDNVLTADWAAFSNTTGRGVASGEVVFTDGVDTVYTAFFEFDLDTLNGVMFDAEFDVPEDHMELKGAEVIKTGKQTYIFKDGVFTTCRCPDRDAREPWQVSAAEADLEVEGYAITRNTTFDILGVPVLWLPWFIYPLKTERQSGLLFPEFKLSGRNGFEVAQPIFLTLGDPVNLTLTPTWLQKRGVLADVELEYVLAEQSKGEFDAWYIHDDDVSSNTLSTPFDNDRWATRGRHDLYLPADFRFKTDYAFASDNAFPQDFDGLGRFRDHRYLQATAFVGRDFGNTGTYGLTSGVRFADDLQAPDDTDRDDYVLQRLPETTLTMLPQGLPFADWLVPAIDVHYVYFHQNDRPEDDFGELRLVTGAGRFLDTGVDGLPSNDGLPGGAEQGRDGTAAGNDPNLDDFALTGGTEGDGVFQEGELIADSGHRILLTPRIGAPFRLLDIIEVYPEVGWHQAFYNSDAVGSQERGLFTGRIDIRTRFRGSFMGTSHLLEPRIGWAYIDDIADTETGGDPFYIPGSSVPQQRLRQLDLENVTLDPADRIASENALTWGIGNRFYSSRGEGPTRLLADFILAAAYSFEQHDFGNIYLDGRAYPFEGVTVRMSLGFDPEEARLDEQLMQLDWNHSDGHSFSLGHRFVRDIPTFFEDYPKQNDRFDRVSNEFDKIHQLDGRFRFLLTERWAITWRGGYSLERSLWLGNTAGIEYTSGCNCWATRFQVRSTRNQGFQFAILYSILGLGDDSRDPFRGGAPVAGFDLLGPG